MCIRDRYYKVTACWELQNCFPYNIGTVQLNNSAATLMNLTVGFYYERYRFYPEEAFDDYGIRNKITIPPDNYWDGTTEPYPDGQWAHSIKVCLESTKISFPNGIIIAHLDRKSFKGWQRQAIKRLCEEIGLPIGRTRDFE